MEDLKGAEALDRGPQRIWADTKWGCLTKWAVKIPFGPKRLFLWGSRAGYDLSKRVRKMVLVAMNMLEDGWPAKKQRFSLGLVGKMHRTASSVCTCVCMCMCGCTSRNLEGKKENQLGGDHWGPSTFLPWRRETSWALCLWKCSSLRSRGHGHLSIPLLPCPIFITWDCGKKSTCSPFVKGSVLVSEVYQGVTRNKRMFVQHLTVYKTLSHILFNKGAV